MEFSSHYDFVLLGEHPAGLWAALRLLELEKKVLILPLGRDSGLNASPKSVIRDFGWKDSEWLDRGSQPIQIITPNRRFRVEGTPEDLEAEYEFQFGQKPAGNPSYEILRGLAYFARGSEAGPVFAEDWKLWVQRALDKKNEGRSGYRLTPPPPPHLFTASLGGTTRRTAAGFSTLWTRWASRRRSSSGA